MKLTNDQRSILMGCVDEKMSRLNNTIQELNKLPSEDKDIKSIYNVHDLIRAEKKRLEELHEIIYASYETRQFFEV